MNNTLLIGLSLVVILSISARLFGSWIKIPVIVPLLAIGVIAGESVTGLVKPNELLGDSLPPFAEITVALILFGGALGLRFSQLDPESRPAVLRLITLGVLITWGLGTLGVIVLIDSPSPIAVLIGAVIIVSGPTVVLPLLSFIGARGRVSTVLKWEGVMIDPIGAIIAVVVFGAVVAGDGPASFSIGELFLTFAAGLVAGIVFAVALMPLLGTHRLSGRDKTAATLMMVVGAFLAADLLFEDAGLFAAVVMGVVLANQARVNITYINEFKETLIPILLGILFVLLAANTDMADVIDLGLPGLALVAFLAFVVRPLVVLTTIGLPITWKERLFMMTMYPRGIVAAATAPVFGLALMQKKVEGADEIIPVAFFVVAGTILISSILGPLSAKLLGLSGEGKPSMLVIGAPDWAISLGKALQPAGTDIRYWTVDAAEAEKVERVGLMVSTDPIDPNSTELVSDLTDLSLIAVVTTNDLLNQLLAYDLAEALEPDQVYRVPDGEGAPTIVKNASRLITSDVGLDEVQRRVASGHEFVVFDSEADLPADAVPMMVMETSRALDRPELFFHCDRSESPRKRVRKVAALVPARDPDSA